MIKCFDYQTIRSERHLFRLIVSSLCPELIGHEMVKSGLVLALFGGLHKQDFETKVLSIRSQIHVLLFGDHGSNKDLLLKAVHSVSPKAQYVCGNTTSFNSLTKNPKKSRTDESFQNGCLISKDFGLSLILSLIDLFSKYI